VKHYILLDFYEGTFGLGKYPAVSFPDTHIFEDKAQFAQV